MQAPQLLVDRLQRYFHHSDPDHDYLVRGDIDVACRNLREALEWLEVKFPSNVVPVRRDTFGAALEAQVKEFQSTFGHPIRDGKVGPGTRDRLVRALLDRFDPSVFRRLQKHPDDKPTVFLSYAWADTDKVDKVDQWLRDHGIRILRDREMFVAGQTLNENIRSAVARADKIVAFYSKNSRARDWPQFERMIADQLEQHVNASLLIYVRLDKTKLPQHDPSRLAIEASAVPLRAIGQQLLHAITGANIPPASIVIDENAPL